MHIRIVAYLVAILVAGCSDATVEGEDIYESPDGTKVVAVHKVIHGADTQDHWTYLSIQPKKDPPYRFQSNIGKFELHGEFQVDWKEQNHLILAVDSTFFRENAPLDPRTVSGVEVTFREAYQ